LRSGPNNFFPACCWCATLGQLNSPSSRASAPLPPFPELRDLDRRTSKAIVPDICPCRVVFAHRSPRALHFTHANPIGCRARCRAGILHADSQIRALPIIAATFRSAHLNRPSSSCRHTTSLHNGLPRASLVGTIRPRRLLARVLAQPFLAKSPLPSPIN